MNKILEGIEKDFFVLAFNNAYVKRCLYLYERGDLSYEQALKTCIIGLCEQNNTLIKKLVKQDMMKPIIIQTNKE